MYIFLWLIIFTIFFVVLLLVKWAKVQESKHIFLLEDKWCSLVSVYWETINRKLSYKGENETLIREDALVEKEALMCAIEKQKIELTVGLVTKTPFPYIRPINTY